MPQLEIFRAWLLAHARSDRGASLVEYCLLVAFIALACFAAVQVLGGKAAEPYSEMGNSLT
jgi:pilus assembly protein Flp/PilA